MRFESIQRGTRRMEPEKTFFHPLLQVDPDRTHIADELARRFFEREEENTLPPPACRIHELRGDARLPRPGGAGDKDGAPPEVPLPREHCVEPRDARGDSLLGRTVIETERSNRQDGKAVFINEERILVRPVCRAPVFDDPQPAYRRLIRHAVIEENDAVGDVFLQTLPRQRTVPPFGRNYRRHAFPFQPAEQAPQLRAEDMRVRQFEEERFDCVKDHAFRMDRLYREMDSYEKPLEIVIAALRGFSPLDADLLKPDFFPLHEVGQVKPQRSDVRREFFFSFFKRDEDPRFVVFRRSPYQKLHRQERFAAAGAAAHERGSSRRQTSAGDFIQSLYVCGGFGKDITMRMQASFFHDLSPSSVDS